MAVTLAVATDGRLAIDDFNRANGPLGANWTVDSGTFDVNTNIGRHTGGDPEYCRYTAIGSRTEMVVYALMRRNGTSRYPGISIMDANNNGYVFTINDSGSGSHTFHELTNNGATLTQRDSVSNDPAIVNQRWYRYKFHVKWNSGSDLRANAWVYDPTGTNWGTLSSGEHTDTSPSASAFWAGIRGGFFGSGGSGEFDDFTICANNLIACSNIPTGWYIYIPPAWLGASTSIELMDGILEQSVGSDMFLDLGGRLDEKLVLPEIQLLRSDGSLADTLTNVNYGSSITATGPTDDGSFTDYLGYEDFIRDAVDQPLHRPIPPGHIAPRNILGWHIDSYDATENDAWDDVLTKGGPPTTHAEPTEGYTGGQGGMTSYGDLSGLETGHRVTLRCIPGALTSNLGIATRVDHNVTGGTSYENGGDGWEVRLTSITDASPDTVAWTLAQRVAGTRTQKDSGSGVACPTNDATVDGFDLVVDITDGNLMSAWLEPLGGGEISGYLFQDYDLATGGDDPFDDTDHQQVGIMRASSGDIGTEFQVFFVESQAQAGGGGGGGAPSAGADHPLDAFFLTSGAGKASQGSAFLNPNG